MRRPSRVVVVGAGMAGLTAAVYLARAGLEVTVFEKTGQVGGLVQSFEREGFVFDAGPRAIGNAGIVLPMLEDLGLEVPLVKSLVSMGVRDRMVHYESTADLEGWVAALKGQFPEAPREVAAIARRMRAYTRMMAALNRVANPFFKRVLADPGYLFGQLIPWLPTFLAILIRTALFRAPVERALAKLSSHQDLNDLVCQAFFRGTPQEFALGYFHNFTDYWYPLGGTRRLPQALFEAAQRAGVRFRLATSVTGVDTAAHTVTDETGVVTAYDSLLWAADPAPLSAPEHPCAESVVSVFFALNLSPEFFSSIAHGHCLYTPETQGLGELNRRRLDDLKGRMATVDPEEFWSWLGEFCRWNSYEVSVPVLKDPSLAPPGKTGLIVSLLFDGELCLALEARGWHREFKERVIALFLERLDNSLYPGLKEKVLFSDCSSPATLHRRFGTRNGSIVGWSLEGEVPVAHHLSQILSAVKTPFPDVYQAGQWTYSPAGVPVAVLTGRIAASRIIGARRTAKPR